MREEIETQEDIENLYKNGSNAPYQALKEGMFGYTGLLLSRKSDGKVQCHICGKWFQILDPHVRIKHKMSSYRYKKTFGFPKLFPLCSKRYSGERSDVANENIKKGKLKFIKTVKSRKRFKNERKRIRSTKKGMKSMSYQNKHNTCKDQLLRRIHVLADELGHFPSWRETSRIDASLAQGIRRKYGRWNRFKKIETEEDLKRFHRSLSSDRILFLLKKYVKENGRIPKVKDFRADNGYCSYTAIRDHFGSWNRALQMAGFFKTREGV